MSTWKLVIAVIAASLLPIAAQQPSAESKDSSQKPSQTVPKGNGAMHAPRVIHSVDPEYSEEALKAKYQGTCVLWLVVGEDGRPRDIRVARSIGLGLDQKAIEAVRKWRFEPARKDGRPVAVQVNVEVAFRLNAPPSPEVARSEALARQASNGDPKAELKLAKAYFEGKGVPRDDEKGIGYLRLAADGGSGEAQFMMGDRASLAQFGAPDYVGAYVWYSLAEQGGYKRAKKRIKELSASMTADQLAQAQVRLQSGSNAHSQ